MPQPLDLLMRLPWCGASHCVLLFRNDRVAPTDSAHAVMPAWPEGEYVAPQQVGRCPRVKRTHFFVGQ